MATSTSTPASALSLTPATAGQPPLTDGVLKLIRIVGSSAIAGYHWPGRGIAHAGYLKGMALTFAGLYGRLQMQDAGALEMAKAQTGDGSKDALAYYDEIFSALGMSNDNDGPDVLRHLFTLMVGLGMRESSGEYCTGRDTTAQNTTADTAEAGLFQVSYNARTASPLLPQVFAAYKANPSGFNSIFKENISCSAGNLQNYGTGDGHDFQQLTKDCPVFAVLFAAIALRNERGHWGPIINKAAEVRPECDAMLKQVQDAVDEFGLFADVALNNTVTA